ncbi:MAG TPA: hypothetical protein VIM22_00475 [Solirubrobacteraceae bacterium]
MKTMSRKAAAGALIALMSFASLMLWVGIPLGWLYIGSQLVSSSQPSMGPYVVVVVGIVASVVIDGIVIGRLNRRYQELTGGKGAVRIQLPWMKSMRGEREAPRTATVLDVILVATVALAGVAGIVWFFAFAGSSLPGA